MAQAPSGLAARIAEFDRWHYEFDLDGHRTPIANPDNINRHRQRERYFFDELVRRCGGSLAGRRVLDLGSNAGWRSMKAIEAGCEFVLGVDARRMHVDQANLVFEVKQVPSARYAFKEMDVFDLTAGNDGPFDVTLCLGLLYHVAQPFELMRIIDESGAGVAVIDTALAEAPGSGFRIRHEDVGHARNAVGSELVMVPNERAVIDLAGAFGYRTDVLEPDFGDWQGCDDYGSGRRKAFLCTCTA